MVINIRCLICLKNFDKRNYNNLLSFNNYLICDKCLKKYKIELSLERIKDNINIYYFFKEFYYIDINIFIYETSFLFEYILNKNKGIILIFNTYYEVDKILKYFNSLDNKIELNILCYFEKKVE